MDAFFTVVMAKDEHYWVKYHHWTGPVYFNVIRSFHHFVVWAMVRTAVR
ncbi:MAG: DUF2867 domain-containing protein [Deltaproteobacteria bacterium]|nr:DUF2867 domain-containing protein [Deltaproteobacteria bacterium]